MIVSWKMADERMLDIAINLSKLAVDGVETKAGGKSLFNCGYENLAGNNTLPALSINVTLR